MDQKTSTASVRFALAALLVVMLATLGFIALSAHADETEVDDTVSTKKDTQLSAEESRNIFSEMDSDGLQDRVMDQREAREEMQELKGEQRSAFAEDRAKRLEVYRSFLDGKKKLIEDRIAEHQEEKEMKRAEYKAKLSAYAQARVGRHVERIVLRMDTAIVRLEQIAERISARIEKTEATGVDLSDAKVELANVKILIEDAHTFVELVGTVSTETLTSETPKQQVQDIRDAVELAKNSISTIRGALAETVKLIRSGIEKDMLVDEEAKDADEDVEGEEELEEASSETE